MTPTPVPPTPVAPALIAPIPVAPALTPPVALTGLGLVTALGSGPDAFWRGLLDGRRALGPLTRFEGDYRSGVVAEVPFSACPVPAGRRKAHLASEAARQALADAGLDRLPPGSLLVVVSQAPAPPFDSGAAGDDFTGPSPSALLDAIGTPRRTVTVTHLSHACASAAFGAALARDWLLAGLGPCALVVGASALNRYEYASMDVVRALSPTGARPLDSERDGVTVGEGGGAFVLESAGHAAARGRPPKALLSGAACLVDGEGAAASELRSVRDCMRAALRDAGEPPVDHVQAHATGTPQGDGAEVAALGDIAGELGWNGVPVSSHKGSVGHLLHASAFAGVTAAVGFLRERTVPGTPGLRTPLELPERLVAPVGPLAVPQARHVLVNSFGFSGNNASLVLSAPAPRP
ncbi:3-oxoacyl-ACP synthase [Streptomyces sp. NBC_00237]|uniref:beta-ketoacyl synthase N-terminal-like domain-containing protein n=1 Tax=Streptomyces sp. NBC_00237 TaxID=2975687 RepID=UPI00224CF205|nr:beta-ketoacyl synthase N-terminal-like domain-containing protein [Streptomyces sp. NBC_00237]MCX5205054.1 3-oxoacyl-ACP synthase [Streptomyces sp. NBC_00237]